MEYWVSAVAQVLSLHFWCQHPVWSLARVPDAPLLTQLPANGLDKAVEDGPTVQAPPAGFVLAPGVWASRWEQ